MPPLEDDRWQLLVDAVLASDEDAELDRRSALIDLRQPVGAQRETDEPSGRRNSSSS